MQAIGTYEAKTHLSALLERVDHGESFAITKHGRVIALLTPVTIASAPTVEETIARIQALRKKISKRGSKLTLREINQWKQRGRS